MAIRIINSVKLGFFVMGGLIFLVLLLYMIGKNRSLFGSSYILKARFENIQGLVPGNNVRFAGIQAGTVKKIEIINDTTIEITMMIDTKMENIIRKNALASIATDGIVGNKVLNIVAVKQVEAYATEGDLLPSKKMISTDEILQTLNKTNKDVAIIAAELKKTVQHLNNSSGLWNLLDDETIPKELRIAVANIRIATQRATKMTNDLQTIVANVKNGKGSVGKLLMDSAIAQNLNDAILKINEVSNEADSITIELNNLIAGIQRDVSNGKGTIHTLLKDSMVVHKLNNSLDNIQKGTDGFNQNMEALKHNFLFRGYFRKQQKAKLQNK